ncbi:hypothetical protein [Streptococcus merionis]
MENKGVTDGSEGSRKLTHFIEHFRLCSVSKQTIGDSEPLSRVLNWIIRVLEPNQQWFIGAKAPNDLCRGKTKLAWPTSLLPTTAM